MSRRSEEISQWLAEQIAAREPGERLPTMREIMQRFGTAQRVVQAAIAPHVRAGRLQVRRGAGIVVSEPATPTEAWEADVLVLYRISDSRLARNLLLEIERRFKARGHTIMLLGFSDERHALSILARLGRFRVCLVQVHFEPLAIPFLAAIAEHAGSVVVDGISATGVGVDGIGTNWREALSVAFRHLRDQGHERIAFLTSAHPARQIAMARREYLNLCDLTGQDETWLIEMEALPGAYTAAETTQVIGALRDADGALPFTALITWGVVEGYVLDRALVDNRLRPGRDLSVVVLGSVDFPSEHLERFDVVGNSNAEKIDLFEEVLMMRLSGEGPPPDIHYLPLHILPHGSVKNLGD